MNANKQYVAVISTAIVGLSLVGCSGSGLPNCNDKNVVDLANQALGGSLIGMMLSGANNGSPVTIQSPTEERYDSESKKRICKAIIKTELGGSQKVHYSIEWHDKDKGMIWLEFVE